MARVAIGADEKKKLYLLGGLFVALAIVGGVVYFPRGGSDAPPTPPTPSPRTGVSTPGAPDDGEAGPGPGAAPTSANASMAPGGISAASLVSVEDSREDPFMRFVRPALPPLPTPTPMPPPVVILPPDQVEILPPGQINSDGYPSGGGLPPMIFNGGQSTGSSTRTLVGLPPVTLPTRRAVPTTPAPPAGQGSGVLLDSPNKRVSGVIIGDSVRALLEISNGETRTTRIVQPGDEVDGIRILRIERVTEGSRTVTRVIIRENGEERSVPLKAAPREATTGGMGGMGGPGMPGGAGIPGMMGGRGAMP